MAGGAAWCQEAASLLAGDELDAALPAHDEWSEVDFTVEHLEPSDEPNVLGRLGGYDVLEIIGHGGMGVVLKAFDRELKRCVAIKVLAPHLAHSSLAKKAIRPRGPGGRGRRASARAGDSSGAGRTGGCRSWSCRWWPASRWPSGLRTQGTLELKEILRIGMQAAAGLAAAHEQGLVHRDVKPANILLEKGVERAVLTDFGLARAADDVSLTRWGIIAGTPQYMSPEQARGEPLDGRSDLFSLGCVLYEMATGVSPFRADSMMATMRRLVDESPQAMASLNPELPPWFIAIVDRLLEKDPSRRFGSAKEVSELLEGCLAHVQQPATVPLPAALATPIPLPQSGRQKTRFKGVIAMLAILGSCLIGWMLFTNQGQTQPDISGQWTGDGWGTIILNRVGETEISGLYSDAKKTTGELQLKWSRTDGRFHGTWQEGNERFGEITLRVVKNEIRGAVTSDARSKIAKDPRLTDFTWVRAKIGAIEPPAKATTPPPKFAHSDPADAKKRASIPEALLKVAGGGNAAKAPPELVWVFSEKPKGDPSDHAVMGLAFSPDGRWLAIYRANSARLWDMGSGEPTIDLGGVYRPGFSTAAFSPDSQSVVTRSADGEFSLWNVTTGALQRELKGPTPSTQIAFSPKDKLIYASGPDGKIKRWHLETGQLVAQKFADEFYVRGIAVSPDGAQVATIDDDRKIRILAANTGEVIKSMDVIGASKQISFSGDGNTFVWRAESRFFAHLLWDVASWNQLPSPPGSGPTFDMYGTPIGIAAHPTRRMVATTWSDDGSLRLWEITGRQQRIRTFRMEVSGQTPPKNLPHKNVAFTADGKYLAVAQYNGDVSLLRVPDILPDVFTPQMGGLDLRDDK